MARQGLMAAPGVVLARARVGEGGLWMTLFLKGQGLLRASAPGAESGRVRFGGGTEPFVWGTFQLHRGRAGGLCLSGVDIVDDMYPLRKRPEALRTAVRWARLVKRFLIFEHPADELLANLYWNMRLLSVPHVPPAAAEWRFLWRWLEEWGLAPDLRHCARCGREIGFSRSRRETALNRSRRGPDTARAAWTGEGLLCAACAPEAQEERPSFTGEDLSLLRQVVGRDVEGVVRMFEDNVSLRARQGVFALAGRCAEGLLRDEI